MGLNIKSERVHELARRAAAVTGTSMTSAIEHALEQLLREHGEDPARARVDTTMRRVEEIVTELSALPEMQGENPLATEWLYDEKTGLPA